MAPMTPDLDTLGLVETRTVASGARILDRMLKTADIDLLRAAPICSGRFLIRVAGLRDAVQAAVDAVLSDTGVIDQFILSRISPQVIRALKTRTVPGPGQALGLVESRRSAPGIAAADAAVKRADVTLARLAVARGINGKSFMVVTGNLAAVEAAVEAASGCLGSSLVERTLIPNPDRQAAEALTGSI